MSGSVQWDVGAIPARAPGGNEKGRGGREGEESRAEEATLLSNLILVDLPTVVGVEAKDAREVVGLVLVQPLQHLAHAIPQEVEVQLQLQPLFCLGC